MAFNWQNNVHPPENGSSHPEMLCKNGVFKNFSQTVGKYQCRSFFFNKVQAEPATLFQRNSGT